MLAAIPAPKEVAGGLAGDNDVERWVLTADSSLIANAGAAAVLGTDKDGVIDALNTRADVPAGFTHYKSATISSWFDSTDSKVKSTPLFQFYDKLYADNREGSSNVGVRNKTAIVLVKSEALIADEKATRIDLLSQARVTPSGVSISRKQLREIFTPNHDAQDVNANALSYGTTWTSQGHVRDTVNWSIKRPVIIDDKHLVKPEVNGTYTLVYNPVRVASLRTRRKNNKRTPRTLRKTAFQSLCGIINAFEREAWQWSKLEWYLAAANYKTRGLIHCARTIEAFTKFATQIGRVAACRKAYKADIQAAWYHRNLLTSNTNEAFMQWYWRELKIAGKPKDALAFEREERAKKSKKARQARQVAAAEQYLAKVSQLKGQTKGDQNVK